MNPIEYKIYTLKRLYFFLLAFFIFNSVKSQVTLTHNGGAGPIETIMFSCSGPEIECWARTYILEDFGISTDHESYVHTGQIAFYTSYAGATAKFNIYAIDENFPVSFPQSRLLGSSQIEPIPWINYPTIMTVNFDTPVVIPRYVERILVEVEKGDDPNSFFINSAYAAGSEYENDFSWYKGCGQNHDYKTTANLNPPRPNANFIVNAIVDGTILSTGDMAAQSFLFYPNPVKNQLNLETNLPIGSFEVYDINGKVVIKNCTTKTLDVSQLNPGIYFIKALVDEKFIIKRFIKQ